MKKRSKDDCRTVLLVEDNPSWILLIQYSLPSHIQFEYATTLQEGLQKDLTDYNVLLLDLILPDSLNPIDTFLHVFREVRIVRKLSLPIVIVSAQDDCGIRREILDYGISGYIDKGQWDRQYLLDVLDKAIHEHYTESYKREYESMIALLRELSTSDIDQLDANFYG